MIHCSFFFCLNFMFGSIHECNLPTHELYAPFHPDNHSSFTPYTTKAVRTLEPENRLLEVGGQEEVENDHHSKRRKGISNQEKKVDTIKMESGCWEFEILSFRTIKVKRVEKAKESLSDLPINSFDLIPAGLVSVLKQFS